MLEIRKKIIDTIYADATIKGLLGATDSDKRIYGWFPAMDVTYTSSIPAAILYYLTEPARPKKWSYPHQLPDIFVYFRIMSINPLTLEQLKENLFFLFDNTSLETDNYSVKYILLNNCSESSPVGSPTMPIYIKHLSFRFTNAFKKS